MREKKCSAKTKDGKPCQAKPLTDASVCMADADAKTREKHGFIARNGKQGRPRKLHPSDVLREELAERFHEVFAPLLEALTAELALVVGNGGSARLE